MKSLKEDLLFFLKDKIFMITLLLTGLGGYGYLLTHETIGMDDTPSHLYFEDGLAAVVGRWVVYLANKVLPIGEFSPFLTDLCGVILLMAAGVVFCALLRNVLWNRAPLYGYVFFAAFLVANPLWAEVFPYYLHNFVGLGYLCTALSLAAFFRGWRSRRKALFPLSGLLLWVAVGCYESYMIVWLAGFLLLICACRYVGEKKCIVPLLCGGAGLMAATVVLRSVTVSAIIRVFSLEPLLEVAGNRSVAELLGWIGDPDKTADAVMGMKRAYVMYGAFAFAYYPIFLFVAAAVCLLLVGLILGVRKRDAWLPFLAAGALGSCFLLVFIEGKATPYRAAQFLPLICAFGVLVLCGASECLYERLTADKKVVKGKKASTWAVKTAVVLRGAVVVTLGILLFNQCAELNKWFYVDRLKYEAARETAGQVYLELQKNYDTSKPVIFTGVYEIPRSIIEPAYLPYGSRKFALVKAAADRMDPHLLEKFYHPQGVWVAQQPILSVIEWGRTAFDSNCELEKFFRFHGYDFVPETDLDKILAAQELAVALELPEFPKEGSVRDMGDYILVNF